MSTKEKISEVVNQLTQDLQLLEIIRTGQELLFGDFFEDEVLKLLIKLKPHISDVLFAYYWNEDDTL